MTRDYTDAVFVRKSILEALDVHAEFADIGTGVLAGAVLEGAMKLGLIDRCAEAALAGQTVPRRVRKRLRWVTVNRGDGINSERIAGEYQYKEWRLVYQGNPLARRYKPEDNGWHLIGPTGDHALSESKRQEAEHEAADIIRRYEKEQP